MSCLVSIACVFLCSLLFLFVLASHCFAHYKFSHRSCCRWHHMVTHTHTRIQILVMPEYLQRVTEYGTEEGSKISMATGGVSSANGESENLRFCSSQQSGPSFRIRTRGWDHKRNIPSITTKEIVEAFANASHSLCWGSDWNKSPHKSGWWTHQKRFWHVPSKTDWQSSPTERQLPRFYEKRPKSRTDSTFDPPSMIP